MKTASAGLLGLAVSFAATADPDAVDAVDAVVAQKAAAAVATAGGAHEIEEVVVTARRRAESLQEVPLAITAISEESLRQQSINTPANLATSVPSLTVASSIAGGSTVTFGIRAQRNLLPRLSNDPSVGVYVNDVVQARPYGLNSSLYDISSVQVLKGPQGTLFGRNTTGGAILFQTNKPTDQFEGWIENELGSYSNQMLTGVVNVPVTDSFALRIAGRKQQRDGYVENVATGEDMGNVDNYSYRVSALWQPTDSLENVLVYDRFKAADNGGAFVLSDVSPTGNAAYFYGPAFDSAFGDIQAEFAAQQERDYYTTASGQDNYSRAETEGVANTTTLNLNGITLKNIFGYRKIQSSSSADFDGTPLNVLISAITIDIDQYSDELQLQGKAIDDRLDYIVGLYYFEESGGDSANPTSALDVPVNPTNPFGTGGTGVSRSASVFSQGTYKFESIPDLGLTVGARYTWDYRELTISPVTPQGCALGASDENPAGISPCEAEADKSFDAVTWNVSLDYHISSGSLVYLTSRHGYRSGGFNIGAQSEDILNQPFGPEKLTDVEVGLKSDFDVGEVPVRTNLAAYHGWSKDLQRSVRLEPGSPVNATINAASAKIYGLEGELTVLPAAGLSATAFFSWDHARYDRFVSPAGDDFTDSRFSFTPEHKYGLKARYELAPTPVGLMVLQAAYSWQSKIYFDDLNEPGSTQGAYGLLNLRAELNDVGAVPLDFAVVAQNVTDEQYASGGQGFNSTLGFQSYNPGEPRMLSFLVRYRFGAE
ncbi:MAG: TonB-dependent receptor [Pseudomonadota bacterium]|nr:TonB-dependent receptor [Pseudomonadota bacterium]